jgi:hypothetical protein
MPTPNTINHPSYTPVAAFTSQSANQCPGYKKLDPLNEDDFFDLCASTDEPTAWLMQKARCEYLAKQKHLSPKERMRMQMLAMNAEVQAQIAREEGAK